MTDKHEAWIADVIERGLRTVYPKGHHGILRDRRLTDADKLRFLDAWESADDFERGEVARARQEVMERMTKTGDASRC